MVSNRGMLLQDHSDSFWVKRKNTLPYNFRWDRTASDGMAKREQNTSNIQSFAA